MPNRALRHQARRASRAAAVSVSAGATDPPASAAGGWTALLAGATSAARSLVAKSSVRMGNNVNFIVVNSGNDLDHSSLLIAGNAELQGTPGGQCGRLPQQRCQIGRAS